MRSSERRSRWPATTRSSTATSSSRWRARASAPGSSPARRSAPRPSASTWSRSGPAARSPSTTRPSSGQVELYVILEGEAVLRIEGEDHPAPAGTFASIEPPASRTILNRSDAPVTAMLIGVQPERRLRADVLGLSRPERLRLARIAGKCDSSSARDSPIILRLVNPSRARSKKARKPGGHDVEAPVRPGASVERYSPERPYKPLVSPPSVEDKDACAIYASVRKDATPSHEPIELAIPALQKMLHRAGNVDGEGDGCGLLLDLPRKIWAEEVRTGGHDPSLTLDDAFAVAHIFIERSQDREKIQHDARELLNQGGFRVLAERIGVVDSPALGPTAREEEPHLLADRRPRPRRRAPRPDPLRAADRARAAARRPRPLLLRDDLRLQGDGRAERARRVLPRPARRALRDDRLLRPQPLLDQHLALVQAGAAVLGARPQRRDQHDRAAAPGGADAGGADPARLLGLPGPQPHDRHPGQPRGPQPGRGDGDGGAADRRGDPRACPRTCTASTCTCTRRWGRSRRARWR